MPPISDIRAAAVFRAVVNREGKMVAALAAIPGGHARFFVLERRETEESFIGRVSAWVKRQGAGGLQMQPPDVVPDGTSTPEFLLRLRASIAADGSDPDASEFDVKNPSHAPLNPEQTN
jgi:hypothetical protein